MLLCLIVLSVSCASTEPLTVVRTEHVVIEKEIFVPIPTSLTKQAEVPKLPANPDTLQLGAVYKATVIRLMIANGRLAEIAGLQPE